MRAPRTACTVAGAWMASTDVASNIGCALADERLGLHERADALFKKERVAFGPLDQQPLEWREIGVLSDEHREQFLCALGVEGIEAELGGVRLAPPAGLVLWAGRDEEQDASGRQ